VRSIPLRVYDLKSIFRGVLIVCHEIFTTVTKNETYFSLLKLLAILILDKHPYYMPKSRSLTDVLMIFWVTF